MNRGRIRMRHPRRRRHPDGGNESQGGHLAARESLPQRDGVVTVTGCGQACLEGNWGMPSY